MIILFCTSCAFTPLHDEAHVALEEDHEGSTLQEARF